MSTWAGCKGYALLCEWHIGLQPETEHSQSPEADGSLLQFSFLEIDYYGVTFDHLVPADDTDPEVLQINIIEIEDDNGVYANQYMDFAVDPVEFVGKKVLAVPRCCGKRKGTQDRERVNDNVLYRLERERKELMTGSTEDCSEKTLDALQSN